MQTHSQSSQAVPTMVAIIVAAKRSGDRELERVTRQRLSAEHGIKISFARDRKCVEACK